jgi:ABC-type phosphate transport system substrate-binding protein
MRKLLLILLLWLPTSAFAAEILVVVHASNPLTQLQPKQVVDLFMGRTASFPGGTPARTLDWHAGSPLRENFYKALTGKSEAQVDAYWATLIFAGRMSPPKQFPDAKSIIAAVAKDPNAIAYVPTQQLPKGVKVVMQLGGGS